MRILFLSRYGRLGASSRVRSLQYIPWLNKAGCHVDVKPLFSDAYIRALYARQGRTGHVIKGYLGRLKILLLAKRYDLVWIEKEIFPFMPAWMERYLTILSVPYVVDYDDALFHRYDRHKNSLIRLFLSRKIDTVMRKAAVVVAGNEYLAERALSAGARHVEIIPTVVDLERYSVAPRHENAPLTIGWIGSPGTSRYLAAIASVLKAITQAFDVRVVAVGASADSVQDLPVQVWPWAEATEVESIQSFDIGIMPLPDEAWERGKCGYKLIQYMACGCPVVASSVGINSKIITNDVNGYLADTQQEWIDALTKLLEDGRTRQRMGMAGRKQVEDEYSLQVQAPRLVSLLHSVPD